MFLKDSLQRKANTGIALKNELITFFTVIVPSSFAAVVF